MQLNIAEQVSWQEDFNHFPSRPDFEVLSEEDKGELFGKIEFLPQPTNQNREAIKILNGWEENHIVSLRVPEIQHLLKPHHRGEIRLHKAIVENFLGFWKELERSGLMDQVLTWNGSYCSRLVRGSTKYLSTHAYGTAFDINSKWNPFGKSVADFGDTGCVFDIVEVANRFGFFWGGHFRSVSDGMHFEFADSSKLRESN